MFKAIVLCALYNLSDDQVEYQMRARLSFDKLRTSSFVRFLGLTLADKVPRRQDGVALPGTTFVLRHAQEAQVSQAGVIEALFNDFDGYLNTQSLPRA